MSSEKNTTHRWTPVQKPVMGILAAVITAVLIKLITDKLLALDEHLLVYCTKATGAQCEVFPGGERPLNKLIRVTGEDITAQPEFIAIIGLCKITVHPGPLDKAKGMRPHTINKSVIEAFPEAIAPNVDNPYNIAPDVFLRLENYKDEPNNVRYFDPEKALISCPHD